MGPADGGQRRLCLAAGRGGRWIDAASALPPLFWAPGKRKLTTGKFSFSLRRVGAMYRRIIRPSGLLNEIKN